MGSPLPLVEAAAQGGDLQGQQRNGELGAEHLEKHCTPKLLAQTSPKNAHGCGFPPSKHPRSPQHISSHPSYP